MERIDLDKVLRQRLPRQYGRIPKAFIRGAERLICQDDLNALIEGANGQRDAAFCRSVLAQLNVTYRVAHPELLPTPGDDHRVIFTCNHPLGALDGIIIIDMLSSLYGPGVKFIVNDLLCAIEPLSGIFLPVNKHGAQSRASVADIEEAMATDKPVIIFPAGLCSRASLSGKVTDLKWNKMFVSQAIRHRRDIIPLHFEGRNSASFYIASKLRQLTGMKLNLEMLLLPREIFRCRNKQFTLTVGRPIPFSSLHGGPEAADTAAHIRDLTYSIPQT
ncbi:MAG: 1-acyl-sn-glycerol-3-phosphate acyltransferase [Pseudoflavonifractor sp.]|nr:1-acyl-sn-glycerol-3-phosphate acyltransferase [Alloprevotella sp.]MCM1116751.1 1-acyl-sn-glycerol-3-phosphate acyltransferase [Pseudoflavonifractor sp.]